MLFLNKINIFIEFPFKFSSEYQNQYETLSYNQQQSLQPTFDNHLYQASLPAVPDESVNVRGSQQATNKLEILHHHDTNYIAKNNEILEVDSYSNYHNSLQPADIQSSDSQNTQPLHFNNQEHFQPEPSQTTFAGTYDYYNQNPSIHQTFKVS